jgi:hypothetical protein
MNALCSAKIMLGATAIFVCSGGVLANAAVQRPSVENALGSRLKVQQARQQHDSIDHHTAVDYCYRGKIVDRATGEMVDAYVVCPGDGLEQNLDLA